MQVGQIVKHGKQTMQIVNSRFIQDAEENREIVYCGNVLDGDEKGKKILVRADGKPFAGKPAKPAAAPSRPARRRR